jgi:hypothetical protein
MNITFVQNHPKQVNGKSTVALVRESLMLEARGSSNLFSILNSDSCLKEYCLPLSIFMVKNIDFVPNSPFQVNGEKL